MANTFEKILEKKSEECACEIFYTQWCLAKDYVPKVQSLIVRTFPHYSLHDASHSETILNCIVRILGEKAVSELSCADLWLLLSAAYYHDLGMAVFAKDLEEILKNDKFFQFVKECQSDVSNPLHPFAQAFEVRPDGVYFRNIILDAKTYDGSRFLLAEFIRKCHAERSGKSLTLDDSIHLPGDPIPNRLIRLLARICEIHTQGFDKIMSLPAKEVGLGTEDCHPRFIAAMLRIGDLLDLDNNRFSDVLLKTLPVIPRDSLLHKKKHLSIEHIRIDQKRIEVSARCDDYDVADITNQWLEMISNEFRRQRDVWQELVPEDFPAYLPTVGELKVDLDGYDTINGKKRPGFEMDTTKAIEMLQGAGLYTTPAQCMRELLQNAVDATYLAIYQKEPKAKESLDAFLDACRKETIEVVIDRKGIEGDKVIWHVSIEDNGIGMGKEDLGYLTRTGSKNKEKQRIIESMPEYMRPSGTFGIGFQSVFLMTDKVLLRTRKLDSSEEITAEMYNPASPERKGAILIRTDKAKMHYGTRVEFDFRSEKNLDHWSVSSGQTYAQYTVYSYDFVQDKTLDLDTARVLDEILSFSLACPLTLLVELNGEDISFKRSVERPFDYYAEKQGLQLSLLDTGTNALEVFYRNQIIKNSHIRIPFLAASVNIMSGNAKDLLTLNRNELCYPGRQEIKSRIIEAYGDILLKEPSCVSQENAPLASMFLQCYRPDEISPSHTLFKAWENYRYSYHFPEGQWPYTFGQIVKMSEGKPVVWVDVDSDVMSGVEETDGVVVIKVPRSRDDSFYFLLERLAETHPYPSNSPKSVLPSATGLLFSTTPVNPISDWDAWASLYLHNEDSGRTLMPCNTEFKALMLRKGTFFPFARDRSLLINGYPEMICPYVRELSPSDWYPRPIALKWSDADGELFKMTFEHRAEEAVTIEDIKESYGRLKALLDPIVKALSPENGR